MHTYVIVLPTSHAIPKLRHQHQDLVQLCAAALPDINKDGGCCSFTEILDHQNTSEYIRIHQNTSEYIRIHGHIMSYYPYIYAYMVMYSVYS
jgi:hypothetical protein